MIKGILSVAIFVFFATASVAQSTFDDFLKQDQEAQQRDGVADEDLRKFEEVLNGDDVERALRAMKFMLNSEKPRLVRYAKEFGLLSAEALFRQEALNAVLDQGGPFQIEIDLPKETKLNNSISTFQYYAGNVSADNENAFVMMQIEYDQTENCWVFNMKGWHKRCVMRRSGTRVSLTLGDQRPSYASSIYIRGDFRLDDAGALVGSLEDAREKVPLKARILLIE